MRTLRTRTVGILAALAVMIWAGAASASSISMIWISASAGLGVGTPTLTGLSVSDTAVLEIRWTVSSPNLGIGGMGVRATYDPTVVIATGVDPCPATANNFFGGGGLGNASCGGFGTNIGGAAGFIPAITTTLNGAGGLGAQSGTAGGTVAGAGQANGSMWELAHIYFHATGPGTTGGYFWLPGVDGQVPIGGGFSFPTSPSGFIVTVVPEPGTFAMLALGLGALAFAGRRR